jgi:hypothetical protein
MQKRTGSRALWTWVLAGCALAALSSAVWAEVKASNEAAASMARLTGDVQIQQHGQWVPAYRSAFLFDGDQVVTKQGRAEVQFADGSIITLTQFGKMTLHAVVAGDSWLGMFRSETKQRTVELAGGKLWFDIRPEAGVQTAFETPTVTCGILGTAGELGHDSRLGTVVGLSRGLARVTSKMVHQSVRLRANERTRVPWEGPPLPPQSYTPSPVPPVDLPAGSVPAAAEPLWTGPGTEGRVRPGAGEGEFQVTLPPPPTGGSSGSGSVSP